MLRIKKDEHLQLQVGLFFTLGLGLVFLAIFLLGSRKGLFTDNYTVYAYFDDISGLRQGSPVQLAGIKVGVVSEISFEEVMVPKATDAQEAATEASSDVLVVKVKTALELNKDYKNRICTDSVASVVTEGLLGDRLVFLTVGCRTIIPKEGETVEQPTSLANNQVLKNVAEPKGFSGLVDQGDELMRDAQVFVKNTNTLVVSLNKIVASVNDGDGLAHKLVYDKDVGESLHNIQNAAQNLEAATVNLNSITHKVDSGQGTVGALINDASLYNDLKLLMGKANRNKLVRSVVRYTLKTKDASQSK